jgi:transglutaminase-like putative cysteine protease
MFYEAEVEVSTCLVNVANMVRDEVAELDPEGIPYLFPSRYCQSDILRQQADKMFGHLESPYKIAMAVSDWIYENISYVIGSSGETCSALETFNKREGVCRDFAHLGIALCRAVSVPARYASVYAHQLVPQDFHACFEVFIGGMWYIFDPTRLAPLNGMVRIATGRDAADVAVCTYFGDAVLTKSEVSCVGEEVGFEPVTRDSLASAGQAIALL